MLFQLPTISELKNLAGALGRVFKSEVEAEAPCHNRLNEQLRVRRHAEGNGGKFNGGAFAPTIDGKFK